jgi:glutaredoxin 3
MPSIEIFTRGSCPYCVAAKRLLTSKGQTWDEVDIGMQPARRAEMIERSGRSSVPQIWIAGEHVGGFDDLEALDAKGKLDPLLAGEGA